MIEDDTLAALCAIRWTVPVLALAHRRAGLRFAEAVRTLGMARTVARRTFDEAVAQGWLARNPGHGHPLRPEYLLTAAGAPLAACCDRVDAARAEVTLTPGDLTRWTLPAVARLSRGEARFSELAGALAPVTPRALSATLKAGLTTGLIDRRLEDRFPPLAIYSLDARGWIVATAMA